MKLLKVCIPQAARLVGIIAAAAGLSFSQTLPTAKSIAAEMGVGWNLGNTMEATGGPPAWGNDIPTQTFIDSVKAAGFKTIRIPAAWDEHANPATHIIDPDWMGKVKLVVDQCIQDSLFVVLNIHWDGGWLEKKVDAAVTDPTLRDQIKAKQGAYWGQIATTFRNYDRHLLFASANEPAVNGSASMAMLNSFHQIFIDTVRATGGNNASRSLIIQGPSTDLEKTNTLMTSLPTDKIADRLMAEVHFYPYQFALMEQDADWGKVFYYWGKNNHSSTDTDRNSTWGEEAYTDSVFNLMKAQFVDKNIPALLGEMGAVKRMTLTGESLRLHILSRRTWYEYVVSSANARGLIPVIWDQGAKGNLTMSVFDRKTGGIYDLGLLNAIRSGIGLPKLPGDTELGSISLAPRIPIAGYAFRSTLVQGNIHAAFFATASGSTQVALMDLKGSTVWSHSFGAQTGWNLFEIPAGENRLGLLRIRQNGWNATYKILP